MKLGGAFGGFAFLMFLLPVVDLTFNTAATGIITAGLATPHINPPPKNVADKSASTSPVALFVQLTWGDGLPHDLDLYVKCLTVKESGETYTASVNYSQPHDAWLDLNRDDLGLPSVINMERVESNSTVSQIPPQTHCSFNVHLYHTHDGPMPVKGTLLAIQDKDDVKERLIASVPFVLSEPGEELTLVSAVWDENGVLLTEALQLYPHTMHDRIATK